jgi:hypothetical protein
MTNWHRSACIGLALLCTTALLAGCDLEDSRLGDADLPYPLTLGTTYSDVVLPATHADHWQFVAPTTNGTGNVSVEITTFTTGLGSRISATTDGAGISLGSHGGEGLETDYVTGQLTPGSTYYLIIDSPGGIGATYTLTVSAYQPS